MISLSIASMMAWTKSLKRVYKMKKPTFCFITALLAIMVLFTGCKENTKLKKNSIILDTSKKQSATVTDLKGASFKVESGGTIATVIAMPGVFPAGTNISITPLTKNKGLKGEKLSTFYDVKAINGGKSIQPSMPVFLTLALESDLPDSACLMAYNDGESVGYKVKSQIFRENGITYVTAELNHLTIFGIGDDGKAELIPPSSENDLPDNGGNDEEIENDGDWKEWRFVVNGPAKDFVMLKDNETWEFKAHMQLTALNTGGNIGGFYTGNPVIKITGKAKKGFIPKNEANIKIAGNINLNLSGKTDFYINLIPKDNNITTDLRPGDPLVDVGEWLYGPGTLELQGDASIDLKLKGANIASDAGYQDKSGQQRSYDCSVRVCAEGAFINIPGLGSWDAVMVGVPKDGIPAVSSNEKVASSDSEINAGVEQQGGNFGITREGWPTDDISGDIPVYAKGEVVNSGGDETDFAILVDNTSEEDLNEYLQTLENNGWYIGSDFAVKKNITLYFQFNAKNFLQISVYTEELGTWPADKLPDEIVPPEKGLLIGNVEIIDYNGDFNAYGISYKYSGLSEDDVRGYMESYLNRGWEGDQYYIKRTITWKGKKYKANMEPMLEQGNAFFTFNLIAE